MVTYRNKSLLISIWTFIKVEAPVIDYSELDRRITQADFDEFWMRKHACISNLTKCLDSIFLLLLCCFFGMLMIAIFKTASETSHDGTLAAAVLIIILMIFILSIIMISVYYIIYQRVKKMLEQDNYTTWNPRGINCEVITQRIGRKGHETFIEMKVIILIEQTDDLVPGEGNTLSQIPSSYSGYRSLISTGNLLKMSII